MAKIVLLSDVLSFGTFGSSRYMGPHIIASELRREGFETSVIDYFTGIPDFFSYLEKFLQPDTLFVGIASTFLVRKIEDPNISRAERDRLYNCRYLWFSESAELSQWLQRLRETLNRICPKAKIILGGTKASDAWYDPEAFQQIDYIVLSGFDATAVEFARELEAGRPIKVNRVGEHINYIDNTAALGEKRCPVMTFTEADGIAYGEALPIEVSRGCVFNCKFCYFDRKESIRKDISALRSEFMRNYEVFGTTVYHFCDDCFNDSRKKVEEICTMLLGLPFHVEWISYARVDLAVRFPHTIELMVESGARGLYFGLESLNYEVARRAGKGTPPDKVKDFLQQFRSRFGERCLIQGSFIMGLPGESRASLLETKQWLVESQALDFIDVVPLYIGQYSKELDKITVDYSDYSRNPEQYGLKVNAKDRTWEHSEMNSSEAIELGRIFENDWLASGHDATINTIWHIPIMRTLGFSWQEILLASRSKTLGPKPEQVRARFLKHRQEYWRRLAEKSATGATPEIIYPAPDSRKYSPQQSLP